jgi:hypothetical protein
MVSFAAVDVVHVIVRIFDIAMGFVAVASRFHKRQERGDDDVTKLNLR